MNATTLKPHDCSEEHAAQFLYWIRSRGGLALFNTLNLSNPGQSWTSPVLDGNGNVVSKPHVFSEANPHRIITNTDEVLVHLDHEVKRFHVALRMSGNGLMLKLTDGSTDRVNKAVAKAGEGAYHLFDFETQEAIILAPVPGKSMTLTAWAAAHNL